MVKHNKTLDEGNCGRDESNYLPSANAMGKTNRPWKTDPAPSARDHGEANFQSPTKEGERNQAKELQTNQNRSTCSNACYRVKTWGWPGNRSMITWCIG